MNEIEQIKDLLFGREKQRIDAISRRLEMRESRAADVADVLPESIRRSKTRSGERLEKALQEPVELCLKQSIRKDPQGFADLLFPVIGPAIRKSIAEALRSFTQSINQAVDHSLSPQGLSWRLQAMRAGVPYSQYVMQKTLVYRVEQAYLIHRDTGLLISHVHRADADIKDREAVSAMFTAIQDFVKDSFSGKAEDGLDMADVGEFTVWAVHGPHAMLACVIRGVPPRSLRDDLSEILERVHVLHGDEIETFAGDAAALGDAEAAIGEVLDLEDKRPFRNDGKSGGNRGMMALLLLVPLALAGWWVFNQVVGSRHLDRVEATLASVPGIVVTESGRNGRQLYVRGLRDPEAIGESRIADLANVERERIDFSFTPYLSLEPGLVLRRVANRLEPPSTAQLSISDGVLIGQGSASAEWREGAAEVAPYIDGVNAVDFSGFAPSSAELLRRIREKLDPPESVSLAMNGKNLVVGGSAPLAWIERLEAGTENIDGVAGVETFGLDSVERLELLELAESISAREVFFVWREFLRDDEKPRLADLATQIREFGASATELSATPEILLTGHSDPSGSREVNERLQVARATTLKTELTRLGVKPEWLFVRPGQPAESGDASLEARKVTLRAQAIAENGVDLVRQ